MFAKDVPRPPRRKAIFVTSCLLLTFGLDTAEDHRLRLDKLDATLDQRITYALGGRVARSDSGGRTETTGVQGPNCLILASGLDTDWKEHPVLLDQRLLFLHKLLLRKRREQFRIAAYQCFSLCPAPVLDLLFAIICI